MVLWPHLPSNFDVIEIVFLCFCSVGPIHMVFSLFILVVELGKVESVAFRLLASFYLLAVLLLKLFSLHISNNVPKQSHFFLAFLHYLFAVVQTDHFLGLTGFFCKKIEIIINDCVKDSTMRYDLIGGMRISLETAQQFIELLLLHKRTSFMRAFEFEHDFNTKFNIIIAMMMVGFEIYATGVLRGGKRRKPSFPGHGVHPNDQYPFILYITLSSLLIQIILMKLMPKRIDGPFQFYHYIIFSIHKQRCRKRRPIKTFYKAKQLIKIHSKRRFHSYSSKDSVSLSFCLFFCEVTLFAQFATISPTLLVISRVSSLLMNLLQRQIPRAITMISETMVTNRMMTTWLLVLLVGGSTSAVFVAQQLGGLMRLEQIASAISAESRFPLQIMLLMATSGKLSKPSEVYLALQEARVFMGSTLQTSSMFIFLSTFLVHWSRLFQSPSQYLSKRFIYSNHFSGPLWLKMAIWCSSSLMIFWPTLYWLFSQSKQQQLVRQQFSWLQDQQLIVWQIGSRVMNDLSWEYSFLNYLRNTQVLRFDAEMKRFTVAAVSCGMGNFAVIYILFSFLSFSQDSLVIWRQVICTFFPFPSSDSITFPFAQSAFGDAMMTPFAPTA